MTEICVAPYATFEQSYRGLGYSVRPSTGKSCYEKGWNVSDDELPPGTYERWLKEMPKFNIGLRMGTEYPDGTRIGALDIDHLNPKYVELGRLLLGNPVSGRVGSKGAVFFFRYPPLKFKHRKQILLNGKELVADILLTGLVVIPPSIHPGTKKPYTWLGKPLHETHYSELPFIGE